MPTTTRTLPFERPGVREPPTAYAELRRTAPVARVTTPDGTQAWLVTSYDAVASVLADPRFGVAPLGGGDLGNHTLFQDGDAHARLRRLVSAVFTPRHVESMRARIEELAADHVSAMAAAGPPAALVDALAAPLSITAIGELLGIPADDRAQLRRRADTVLTLEMSVPTGESDATAMEQAW